MYRMFWHILLIAAFAMALPSMALAASDTAKVTYKNGKKQVFHLNRDASLIRRVMFDSEKPKDRLVVTYRDDTHQVFKLKQKVSRIKRLVFDGGDKVEKPPKPPAPKASAKVPGQWAAESFVPSGADLGSVWQVTEKCGRITWSGTWTRRGMSNIFDAYWVANTGDKLTGIVEFREISGGRMSLYRADMGGSYEGTLSRDRRRVINGWATWYSPNCLPWFAVID
jgi:hypothetical protein